jgi:hypothetical protein
MIEEVEAAFTFADSLVVTKDHATHEKAIRPFFSCCGSMAWSSALRSACGRPASSASWAIMCRHRPGCVGR